MTKNLKVFSPFLLLLLLFLVPRVKSGLSGLTANEDVAVLRYMAIPIIGVAFTGTIILWILDKKWDVSVLDNPLQKKLKTILGLLSLLLLSYVLVLSFLRYHTLHTSILDFGTYDNKIWKISASASLWEALLISGSELHFQPFLLLYGLIYKLFASPMLPQMLLSMAVISGVIPLYLVSRKILKSACWTLAIVLTYLLYPSVEYISIAELHPDPIYLASLMWAYYLAEERRYAAALLLAGLGGTTKEVLLLGSAFFGLYVAMDKKKYLLGLSSLILYTSAFLIVTVLIQPVLSQQEYAGINILYSDIFPFLKQDQEGSFVRHVIDNLSLYKSKKLLFLFFLLAPVLFLPLLEWRKLLPAVPVAGILFVSGSPLHLGLDSQYTAGIVPPVFFSLIYVLGRLAEEPGGKILTSALLAGILCMSLTFNIAHSPSILSPNFWSARWSSRWHHSIYSKGDHEKMLVDAINLVDHNPAAVVVSQNNVNHAKLSHRWSYSAFPFNTENAEYILLDRKRPLFVGDHIDPKEYTEVFAKIKDNPDFQLLLDKDGILLFKKKPEETAEYK